MILRGARRSLVDQYPELGFSPQRLRPGTWPEHQNPVSHTAQKKRENKKVRKKERKERKENY